MADLPARRRKPQLPAQWPTAPRTDLTAIYEEFLERTNDHTRRAYEGDLAKFTEHWGAPSARDAIVAFLALGQGEANMLAGQWRRSMQEEDLAPNTINRRLAALRSVTKLAYRAGQIPWRLDVPNVRRETRRDTRGPDVEKVRELLERLDAAEPTPKALRDAAIVHLLFRMALRRKEVTGLDLGDVDLGRGELRILGKGRKETEWVRIPRSAAAPLERWIEERGYEPGPLFTSLDPARKGDGRLQDWGVNWIVKNAGAQVGIDLWPHALRHAGITVALDATGGDLRKVQAFSRHEQIETLMRYDDKRRKHGREVTERMEEFMDT